MLVMYNYDCEHVDLLIYSVTILILFNAFVPVKVPKANMRKSIWQKLEAVAGFTETLTRRYKMKSEGFKGDLNEEGPKKRLIGRSREVDKAVANRTAISRMSDTTKNIHPLKMLAMHILNFLVRKNFHMRKSIDSRGGSYTPKADTHERESKRLLNALLFLISCAICCVLYFKSGSIVDFLQDELWVLTRWDIIEKILKAVWNSRSGVERIQIHKKHRGRRCVGKGRIEVKKRRIKYAQSVNTGGSGKYVFKYGLRGKPLKPATPESINFGDSILAPILFRECVWASFPHISERIVNLGPCRLLMRAVLRLVRG